MSVTKNKVAIVGGGASGLLCAIFCARKSWHVEIFEQNNKCAKKILVSGNGRCNITNTNLSSNDFFGENPSFVNDALKNFGFKEFEKFAQDIGLLLDIKEDGRVYPLSNEAKSVAKLLEEVAKNIGVVFHTETKITDIKALLKTYDKVVVATGSEAASHLGGNSDGQSFAKLFGHTIIPTYPSLVQLHLSSKITHKMSGAKTFGEVTLFINNKKDSTCRGDILFTDYGVSGFAILDISQKASVALMNSWHPKSTSSLSLTAHVEIFINLLPNFNAQTLTEHIAKIAFHMPKFTLLDILIGLVPIKIASSLLDDLKIPHAHAKNSSQIDTKLVKKIANQMLNWRFEVKDTHGFRHAEVSGGGVNTSEINPKTMESLKQKNLYFCGEVLDIVGKRGGYNFAFAWASGYTVAKDITN
ncbi:MAG: NAD(P)/FAD-dependent oxidoreductase [Campylobacterales bacterium]|nr:NAD(P)/FAD-dependent oxidoreductase [Campylobacterales bacterium]